MKRISIIAFLAAFAVATPALATPMTPNHYNVGFDCNFPNICPFKR